MVRSLWRLARIGGALGLRRAMSLRPSNRSEISRNLELAGLPISAVELGLASGTLSLLVGLASVPLPLALIAMGLPTQAAISAFVCVAMAFLAGQAVLAYPASLVKKRASSVLRNCPESTNLMIMSLRHDSSVSRAIAFASVRRNAFTQELRRCVWSVVMGRYTSFEEALHFLGRRWSAFSSELSTSLDALVTASREPTPEGRRRALDRANSAMVAGAKRRIEDYALSLSAPSMVLFALGILLPLMVGSFLPMMSWNLWSLEAPTGEGRPAPVDLTAETVFLMNVLFPAIALLVAMNAISRHPLNRGPADIRKSLVRPWHLLAALAASGSAVAGAWTLINGDARYPAVLLGAACPIAVVLMMDGRGANKRENKGELEEALFRTGARMVEGENFEAALGHAGAGGGSEGILRSLSFRSNVIGLDFEKAVTGQHRGPGDTSNAGEGIKIVRDAASKDELAAGILAMDLSAYLKDLHEIERSLISRLRPTISMMRMTTLALGPIVMGVTFAIYLSLAAMTGGNGAASAGAFMLLLGAFLAETDLIVCYYVLGIEGERRPERLSGSFGLSLLSSEVIFVATATLAS